MVEVVLWKGMCEYMEVWKRGGVYLATFSYSVEGAIYGVWIL